MKKGMLAVLFTLALAVGLLPAAASAATNGPCNGSHTETDGWTALTQQYYEAHKDTKGDLTLTAGEYYLDADITVSGTIYINKSNQVTLCLNGNVLRATTISLAGTYTAKSLTLCDCRSDVTHYGNIGADGLWEESSTSGNCDLKGGVITGCTGSGVYVQYGTLNMYGGNIAGNTCSLKTGGGVRVGIQGTFNMYGGVITGNTAEHNGGGICLSSGGSLTLQSGATVSKNTAANGGGIYISSGSLTLQSGATVSENTAANGGGIYIDINGSLILQSGATVSENTATNGGGVYTSGSATLSGTVSNNTVTQNGGGVYARGGTLTLQAGGSVSQNEAFYRGGGIYADGTVFTMLDGSAVSGNFVRNLGGGICLFNSPGSSAMNGGTVSGNSSNTVGGGIYIGSGSFTISGGEISGNQTSLSSETTVPAGGGVAADNDAQLTLTGGIITGNTSVRGGGVFINEKPLQLSGNPVISGNTGSAGSNLYLRNQTSPTAIITLSGPLTPSASISVTMEEPGAFIKADNWEQFMVNAEDPSAYFSSGTQGYHVGLQDGVPVLLANSYSVTFHANGGTGGDTTQSFTYDQSGILAANPFSRTGYTFTGWNTQADGRGSPYEDGQEVTNLTAAQGGNVDLYAQWSANSYSVTFHANGGTGGGTPQSFTYDQSGILAANPFSRTGYTFTGWNTQADGRGFSYADGQQVTNLTAVQGGNVDLYAQWSANSYPVTLHLNEGVLNPGTEVTGYTYNVGAALPTEADITRPFHRFDGWFDNAELTGDPVTAIGPDETGSREYWAKWISLSSDPSYPVNVAAVPNGSVWRSTAWSVENFTVVVRVYPDEGYALQSLTVTDSDGSVLALTQEGSGSYSFAMPASAVTVYASFERPSPALPFSDIQGHWAQEAIRSVAEKGLMSGYDGGAFGPDDTLSRAQLCQILYAAQGYPAVTDGASFSDVDSGAWYAQAVAWAAGQGVVGGYDSGAFGPHDPITREQLATILWRFAQARGYDVSVGEDTNILSYADIDQLSAYAFPAMQWACGAGVISGTGDGSTLSPRGEATRAQIAVMLTRFGEIYGAW